MLKGFNGIIQWKTRELQSYPSFNKKIDLVQVSLKNLKYTSIYAQNISPNNLALKFYKVTIPQVFKQLDHQTIERFIKVDISGVVRGGSLTDTSIKKKIGN